MADSKAVGPISFVSQRARLAVSLFLDSRVSLIAKAIPVGVLAYVLSPIDFVPDVVLGLGQLDDAALLVLGITLFFDQVPKAIMEEHRARIMGSPAPTPEPPVDATYRVVE
jgi:uncharacterized membrane protein YkvA (DUF1232 family)